MNVFVPQELLDDADVAGLFQYARGECVSELPKQFLPVLPKSQKTGLLQEQSQFQSVTFHVEHMTTSDKRAI